MTIKTRRGGGRHNVKHDSDRPTDGDWHYHPTQSRQLRADDGTMIGRVFGGLRARHNGNILAAAKDSVIALALLLDAVQRMQRGETVDDLDDRITEAQRAISKAKGEKE